MKTFNLGLIISALVLIALLFNLNSCKKQDQSTNSNEISLNDEPSKTTQHIKDFKERMEYYRNNPGIKGSGLSYTADSATLELESLLNYDFCYTNIDCINKKYTTSQIVMPLDLVERISDPRLMQVYYDRVIDTIQAQMGRINYQNMKLLLVDLEIIGYKSNGDPIVSIGSLVGDESNVVLHNDNWVYGEDLGICGSGNYAPLDGADQLQKRVTDNMLPDPPSGGRWHFTNPNSIEIFPKSDPLTETPNNYRDYKIFYAEESVGIIDDGVKCMSMSDMSFYEYYYIEYAQDFETTTNQYFSHCMIFGKPYWTGGYHIQHDYTIYTGNRYVVYDLDVEDIMNIN